VSGACFGGAGNNTLTEDGGTNTLGGGWRQ
jgi:hypothetical protein